MIRLVFAGLFALATSPVGLEVAPSAASTFTATLTFPAGLAPAGEFRGRVALYGSPSELPIVAVRVSRGGAPLVLRASIRYADIPADWIARFRPDGFDYRLAGTFGSSPVSWNGRFAWDDIPVAGDESMVARFLSLAGVDLTTLAPSASRGVARLRVTNPFSFPLRLAASEYRIDAAGHPLGRGSTRGLIVRPGTSTLAFPITIDHGQLIAAAGTAFLTGGTLDAQLRGSLTVRLPGGDVRVPLDLAGEIDAGSLAGGR